MHVKLLLKRYTTELFQDSKVLLSVVVMFQYVGIKGFSKFSLPQYVKQDLVLFSMPINKQKTRKKDPTLLKVTIMMHI